MSDIRENKIHPDNYTERENYLPYENAALVIRELIENADSPGKATKIWNHCVRFSQGYYLVFLHNGIPFESDKTMEAALRNNTSIGNGGFNGGALKQVLFHLNNKISEAELILWSQCTNGKTEAYSLTVKGDMFCRTNVSEQWNANIKNWIGNDSLYQEIKVGYLIRYSTSIRWASKESVGVGGNHPLGLGITTLVSQLTPNILNKGNIDYRVGYGVYGIDSIPSLYQCHYKNRAKGKEENGKKLKGNDSWQPLPSPNMLRDFCGWKQFTFNGECQYKINKLQVQAQCRMDIELYLGEGANAPTLVNVNKGACESWKNEGKPGFKYLSASHSMSSPAHRIFLTSEAMKESKFWDRNTERLYTEPYWSAKKKQPILNALGVSCGTDDSFDTTLDPMVLIEHPGIKEKRHPFYIIRLYIEKFVAIFNEDNENVTNESSSQWIASGFKGNLFYINGDCGDRISTAIANKLAETNPDKILEFKKAWHEAYPFPERKLPYLPIPGENDIGATYPSCICLKADTGEPIKELSYDYVKGYEGKIKIMRTDDKSLLVNLKIDSHKSPGIHLIPQGGGIYLLNVLGLHKCSDNEEPIPISENEYHENNGRYRYPKKYMHFIIGEERLHCKTIIPIPEGIATGPGGVGIGGNPTGGNNNGGKKRKGNGGNRWREMDEHKLVTWDSNGEYLLFNQKNERLREAFGVDDKKHPQLYDKLQDLINRLDTRCRDLWKKIDWLQNTDLVKDKNIEDWEDGKELLVNNEVEYLIFQRELDYLKEVANKYGREAESMLELPEKSEKSNDREKIIKNAVAIEQLSEGNGV